MANGYSFHKKEPSSDREQALELKRVLIISPYFPPCNTADMQRVRMSLPFFSSFGWEVEIIAVNPNRADVAKDALLVESVPASIQIHYAGALSKRWTSRFGLGSLGLRSLFFIRKLGDRLLKEKAFDLIYFSTTEFPVCILGAHWKKKFRIPFVIDMQDPWHSEYYLGKPKSQRPPKYWFSYRLHRFLEPKAMRYASGLISVSEHYIHDLQARYTELLRVPNATITFGAFPLDMEIARKYADRFERLLDPGSVNIIYVGRGGADMHRAVSVLLSVFKEALTLDPRRFSNLRFYFIGTSYASADKGKFTIMPLADRMGLREFVTELIGRISYYHSLETLEQADALFIPGSDDPKYTASKIYPYLLAGKPLLAVFHPQSPAIPVLQEYGVSEVYNFIDPDLEGIRAFLERAARQSLPAPAFEAAAVEKYGARAMTGKQCDLFNKVIEKDLHQKQFEEVIKVARGKRRKNSLLR